MKKWSLKNLKSLEINKDQQKEIIIENSHEEGLFFNFVNNQNNISQKVLSDLNRKIESYTSEEQKILSKIKELKSSEKNLKKTIKESEEILSEKFTKGLIKLSDEEALKILLDDKWILSIINILDTLVEEVLINIEERIEVLKDRYGETFNETINNFNKSLDEFLEIKDLNDWFKGWSIWKYNKFISEIYN